ncbi:hypothetical protein DM860_004501 [Cuscuta australis]|uniref:Uncharacterized protein n=1 Tax=Cuscuta australis TaxID=267555 RepID=A0A328E8W8_9ASTE|nr:hypothetical protein DM860_004501 [Cuscuta australis]
MQGGEWDSSWIKCARMENSPSSRVSWIMKWHYTEDGTLVITQKSKRSGDCLRQIHEELRSQPCNAKGRFLAPEGRDDTERGANDAEKPDCNVGLRFQPQYIL